MRFSKLYMVLGLTGATALGISGCGAGTEIVSASELESAGVSAVKAQTGEDSQMDCGAAEVKVEVGASATCEVVVGEEESARSAQVRVASVSEDGYAVDVVLDPALESQVPAVSGEEVQTMVSNELKSVTHADPSVVCGDSLPRQVGASTACQVKFVGEDEPRSAVAVVKSVSDQGVPSLDVKLSPSVADEPLSDSRGSVAGVVASALEDQLGERPKVDCGGGFVVLREGQALSCSVSSVSGEVLGEAQVVLRDVVGGSYAVDVALEQPAGSSVEQDK
ncbi:hypothetical protein IDM48_10910 [Rothia amarae]|uniref:DUF4333 domain-containing protein n=1 Tax=Rothia amarae TaxID=169480 RepID=A0A7H2BJJ5_9MICC|nr:hypothetical protein [Rothia amarae]QNV39841.1 hypothetical protein IDM48_10910 [Rothia amarae]